MSSVLPINLNLSIFLYSLLLIIAIALIPRASYSNIKTATANQQSPKAYLVEKLENLDRTLPEGYSGKAALQLRLAHILSLLADENFTKSKEGSCQSCLKKSQMSAKKSLSLYHQLSPLIFSGNQSFLKVETLFQKAYLERILGNRLSALSQLQKITVKKNLKADWLIRAWYGIGEIEFELYNYQKALKAFDRVLINLSNLNEKYQAGGLDLDKKQLSSWKFKALYHKVWSLFNLSSYDLALNEMLGLISSDLYKKSSTDFVWLDKENQIFRSKLEKEMITIYSYSVITDKNLKILYDFSKQQAEENTLTKRNERLSELAVVLRNMGRLRDSNKTWRLYLTKDNSKENQLKAYFAIFTNKLRLKHQNTLDELSPIVEKIFTLQADLFPQRSSKSTSVESDFSSKNQSFYQSINLKIKEFFYQVDSTKSSLNTEQKNYLLSLYQTYNQQNPRDKDLLLLSALLAKDLKKYKLAVSLFQQVVLYVKDIHKLKDIDEKSQLKWKEKFCVKQMELAELSEDKNIRLQAYDFYIQQGQTVALTYKAIYQKAYLYHQDQEFGRSQPLFFKLALNNFEKSLFQKKRGKTKSAGIKPPEKELRLKSAHLYLSSLVSQKEKEQELIHASGLFKKEFPKEKAEFVKIYNLAVLNYVEKLVKDKEFSPAPLVASQDASIQKAWSILQLFDSKFARRKPLETYHLNQMILAKELLKIDEMDQSLNFLIFNKQTSVKNRDIALKERLWLAELKLDFNKLLKWLKQLNPEDQSKEHSLRLIQIAELSDNNPSSYYEDFLNRFAKVKSSDSINSNSGSSNSQLVKIDTLKSILISLMELSKQQKQKQLLKTYSNFFEENSNDLLYWVLKIDRGEVDVAFLNFFIKANRLQNNSFLFSFLKRKQSLESFQKALSFKKRDPKTVSISRISRAIKRYSNQLSELEKKALALLETQDWTTQVFVAGHWKRELQSFYNFVFQLPIPKGLTEAEQSDYKKLLVEQMQVYSNKIQELEKEQTQLFSQPFLSIYQKAIDTPVFHPYLKWEMEHISELLSEKDQKMIQSFLTQIEKHAELAKQAQMTSEDLEKINLELKKNYKQLKSNPFDMENLKAVLKLEKQRNNKARVRYLSNRIKQLESKRQVEGNRSNKIKDV